MPQMISFNELVKNGFVTPDERERLLRYLQARGKFMNIFGAGDVLNPTDLEVIRHAERAAEVLCAQLRERRSFLFGEVLPLVKELLQGDPKRLLDFESQLKAFAEQIPAQTSDLPLRVLVARLEGPMSAFKAMEQTLNVLREQLH
jgi:hypothetical protein